MFAASVGKMRNIKVSTDHNSSIEYAGKPFRRPDITRISSWELTALPRLRMPKVALASLFSQNNTLSSLYQQHDFVDKLCYPQRSWVLFDGISLFLIFCHLISAHYPHMPIGKVWIYRLLFFVCLSVCSFVCTVTDFSSKDKASGVKCCTLVHGRPEQGISYFGELCSQKPKIGRIGHPPGSKV